MIDRAHLYERMYEYVEKNIPIFHQKRLDKLIGMKLIDVLKRKNPYLYRAKGLECADEIVSSLMEAFLSSQEETLFGSWMEGFAIFINHIAFGGVKSGIPGIDLEFEREGIRYIVSLKSGPNWGNSAQVEKMRQYFLQAKKRIAQISNQTVIAVNGCYYGIDRNPNKGDYLKLCGQPFWELISGIPDLYVQIIEPLGHKARERNEQFMKEYNKVRNKLIREFANHFCKPSGEIDWDRLVKLVSSEKRE